MLSLMVLVICSLPPLAIAGMALAGLRTSSRLGVMVPLAVTAGVLLAPLLMLSPSDAPEAAGLRFRPVGEGQTSQNYAQLSAAPMPLPAAH